jgi:cell division topological specificity factor
VEDGMNLFRRLFGFGAKPSAEAARERLQVLLSHERANAAQPDYLPQMHRDIVDVIRRYVEVDDQKIEVQVEHSGNMSVLEVNIELPPLPARPKAGQDAVARGRKKRPARARPVPARLAESAKPGTA